MKRHGFIFKVLIIMFLLPLFRATPVTSVMAASEPSKEEVYKHAPKGVNLLIFLPHQVRTPIQKLVLPMLFLVLIK